MKSNELIFNFHSLEDDRFLAAMPFSFFTTLMFVKPPAIERVLREVKENGFSEMYFNGRGNFPDCRVTRSSVFIQEGKMSEVFESL